MVKASSSQQGQLQSRQPSSSAITEPVSPMVNGSSTPETIVTDDNHITKGEVIDSSITR
jgi:hypothetical protein